MSEKVLSTVQEVNRFLDLASRAYREPSTQETKRIADLPEELRTQLQNVFAAIRRDRGSASELQKAIEVVQNVSSKYQGGLGDATKAITYVLADSGAR